jgi:hypothetical protein
LLCTAFEDADDSSAEPELPEWLMEVPEDLDVCIAQRHFEEAYNLLERAREFLDKNTATDPVITDIRYTINDLVMFDSCMNLNMLSFLTA